MQAFMEFWTALGVPGQGILLGLVTSGIVAVLQKLRPGLAVVPNNVKRILIALLAGVSTYVAAGDVSTAMAVGTALAAVASAFAAYHLATAKGD